MAISGDIPPWTDFDDRGDWRAILEPVGWFTTDGELEMSATMFNGYVQIWVAQAAMRHSNISLTMNTYTDARLLDTSAAVESLPSLPLAPRLVTPTVTPAPVNLCHLGAISDTLDGYSHSTEKRKNPANPLRNAGFSSIGPAGFEPTTSTTPR